MGEHKTGPETGGEKKEKRPPMESPNDSKIAKLPPQAKPYEVTLGDGLRVTVHPSGARSFNVRFKFDGKNFNLTLGPVAIGLAQARKLARVALGKIAGGENPCAAKAERRAVAKAEAEAAKAPAQDTVAIVAERFLVKHVKTKTRPASAREMERLLRVEIVPKLGQRRLAEISRVDIRQLVENIADRGAPIVANRTLGLLRLFCNWAKGQDIIAVSPCDGLKAPAPEHSRDRVLTDDEVRLFWRATESVGWPFGPLAQMLLLTGQRRDEVGAMTWGEVDLETATWRLAGERVKNAREHVIPLSAPAMRLLEGLPRISGAKGYVFTTSGAGPVDGFSRAKNRIDAAMLEIARQGDPEAAEIPHWTFHDLRRTAASGMAGLGVAPHVIEATLNHASGTIRGVARVYNRHSYSAEKREALKAWGRHVERLASGEAVSNVVVLREPADVWEFGGGAKAEG